LKIYHLATLHWGLCAFTALKFSSTGALFREGLASCRVTRSGEYSPNGRLFALDSFLKITEEGNIFPHVLFSSVKGMFASFLPKLGWAAFWANFSQTHLVTLASCLLGHK
jgi:hypothetical protein